MITDRICTGRIGSGRISAALIASTCLLLDGAGSAGATGFGKCSTAPKSQWKPKEQAELVTRNAGYQVRSSKIDGTCYEVYGTKDGSLFELYYDPATMKLIHTKKLR